METTGISIDRESWMLLREEPLYSARFIDRAGTDELVLVARVASLEEFLDAYPPVLLDMTSWRSSRGVWVVVVSYQLRLSFGGTKGGSFYLDPRQETEARLLGKLMQQDALPIIFLSEDCDSHYTSKAIFDPQVVMTWRQQLEEIQREQKGRPVLAEHDEEFAAAVHELSMQEEG